MEMDLVERNRAPIINGYSVNGGTADIHQTRRGSDFYFAWAGVMGASAFIFIGLALRKPRRNRIFNYLMAAITFVAAISYFTMGSNLGFTPIGVQFHRSSHLVRGNFRQIFYVRYIDWFITTPLLLLALMLTAGMPWPTILWVILVDWIMIVCGLIGALVRSVYKWGFFAFACTALLYIIYQLAWGARRHAQPLGTDVYRCFLMCGILTLVVWICYPIAWGVSEGGNVIAPDSEAVFYGVLDFCSKVVFGALLLWGHRDIDPARLGLRIRDYDDDPAVHAGLGGEKNAARNGTSAPGVIAGTNGHNPTAAPAAPADTTATTAV